MKIEDFRNNQNDLEYNFGLLPPLSLSPHLHPFLLFSPSTISSTQSVRELLNRKYSFEKCKKREKVKK
jgi:hypothetical protein